MAASPARRTPGQAPPTSDGGTSAIVLAAGRSVRMGTPKPLLPLAGKPMLVHVLDALRGSRVREIVLVLGADAERIQREVPLEGVRVLVHPAFAEGMSSSLRAGVRAATPKADGFLIVLGDQPLVRSRTVDALVDRAETTRAKVLVPTYAGIRGNPVLLRRSLSAEIASVTGDVGCKEVVRRHVGETEEVAVDDPGILLDVDTSEDLRRLQSAMDHQVPLERLVADRRGRG